MRRFGAIAIVGCIVMLVSAGGAAAYPTSVNHYYPFQMTDGTWGGGCDTYLSARTTNTAFGAVGSVSGTQDADCSPPPGLEIGSWTVSTKIEAIGTTASLNNPNASGPVQGPTTDCMVDTCSSSHLRSPIFKGDYRVTHRQFVDVTPGFSDSSGTYYLDYPPECVVSSSDHGRITCNVSEYVTL